MFSYAFLHGMGFAAWNPLDSDSWDQEVSILSLPRSNFWFVLGWFFFGGHCRDVLWCGIMGPLDDCCPDCVPTVLLLPHFRSIPVCAGRNPGFSDEPGLFLWFRSGHRVHGHRVVCDHLIRPQRHSRVRMKFQLVDWLCFGLLCMLILFGGDWHVVEYDADLTLILVFYAFLAIDIVCLYNMLCHFFFWISMLCHFKGKVNGICCPVQLVLYIVEFCMDLSYYVNYLEVGRVTLQLCFCWTMKGLTCFFSISAGICDKRS